MGLVWQMEARPSGSAHKKDVQHPWSLQPTQADENRCVFDGVVSTRRPPNRHRLPLVALASTGAQPEPACPRIRPPRKRAAKWALALILLFAESACSAPLSIPAEYQEAGRKALDWTRRVVELGPRPPGSTAHEKQQQIIVDALQGLAAEVVEDDFTAGTPRGPVEMKNIIARFEGTSGRMVVVSGHYDTFHRPGLHFVGANDGGSSTGFLLALAELLKAHPPADDVWLVFFDGEESFEQWRDDDHTYGSRRLARQWRRDGTAQLIKALINVDMIGDADLSLIVEQNSTPWLRKLILETAENLGYGPILSTAGPQYIEDDHVPFLEAGISAVDLIDFEYGPSNRYWHTEEDTLDKLSSSSFALLLHLVMQSLEELERRP